MRGIFLAAALLFTAQAQALDLKPSPAVAEIFDKAQVKGTFVLYDVSANTFTGFDQKRAETRYIPASTFQ
jgi:beta-lactamase class D